MAKLEEMLQLLDLMSQDDLLELLHALGHNKKKSDDALVLQMAIDNRVASMADECTKPVLSTQIGDTFHTYTWAGTGELPGHGWHHSIQHHYLHYQIKCTSHGPEGVSSGHSGIWGGTMSFANAKEFQQNDVNFPATTATCSHCLTTHSILVDLMMGMAPFTVEYRKCIQQLRPYFDLSLVVHYGGLEGKRTCWPCASCIG